jgi:hypothetical protein
VITLKHFVRGKVKLLIKYKINLQNKKFSGIGPNKKVVL